MAVAIDVRECDRLGHEGGIVEVAKEEVQGCVAIHGWPNEPPLQKENAVTTRQSPKDNVLLTVPGQVAGGEARDSRGTRVVEGNWRRECDGVIRDNSSTHDDRAKVC